jgi:hypothetical protein
MEINNSDEAVAMTSATLGEMLDKGDMTPAEELQATSIVLLAALLQEINHKLDDMHETLEEMHETLKKPIVETTYEIAKRRANGL